MTSMLTRGATPGDLLARRLDGLMRLSAADRAGIAALPEQRKTHQPGEDFDEQGAAMSAPRLVVSGWGCRMRTLPDGRRQIFNFLVPGDAIGLCARPNALALSTTVAITRMETADLTPLAPVLLGRSNELPGLTAAWAVAASLEEAALLDQLVRLGRQTAYERTAHLLLELRWRLAAVELADDRRFPMPLTQEVLADALGLSIVHVNRTLQQLRRERLIVSRPGAVELADPEALAAIADFVTPRPSSSVRSPAPRTAETKGATRTA